MASFCFIVLDSSLGAGPLEVMGVEFCTVVWEEFDLVGSEEMDRVLCSSAFSYFYVRSVLFLAGQGCPGEDM